MSTQHPSLLLTKFTSNDIGVGLTYVVYLHSYVPFFIWNKFFYPHLYLLDQYPHTLNTLLKTQIDEKSCNLRSSHMVMLARPFTYLQVEGRVW